MKELFHIKRGEAENVQPVLSLRMGERHGCFAVTDKAGNELYELAYCTTQEWNEKTLDDFLTRYPSMQQSFYQVLAAYDTPQGMLTPSSFFQSEDSPFLLRTMRGAPAGSHIISELIPEWQLYNTYAVPGEIFKWIHARFPAAKSWHQYSLAVRKVNAGGKQGAILVDFLKDDFTMLVAGNSRLMLEQSFPYSTSGDVVYYLLKACRQFSLSQKEVSLQLSGLIDPQSALFKELCQYFTYVGFRQAGWNAGSEYPPHFFTALNDLAQCAS